MVLSSAQPPDVPHQGTPTQRLCLHFTLVFIPDCPYSDPVGNGTILPGDRCAVTRKLSSMPGERGGEGVGVGENSSPHLLFPCNENSNYTLITSSTPSR
jgi:hypothetical protein